MAKSSAISNGAQAVRDGPIASPFFNVNAGVPAAAALPVGRVAPEPFNLDGASVAAAAPVTMPAQWLDPPRSAPRPPPATTNPKKEETRKKEAEEEEEEETKAEDEEEEEEQHIKKEGNRPTTICIRNIPHFYHQQEILTEMLGAADRTYDFLAVPHARRRNVGCAHARIRNVGCAFINFISHEAMLSFCDAWQGVALEPDAPERRLDLQVAAHQGLEANLAQIMKSKWIHFVSDASHYPIVVQPDGTFADFAALLILARQLEEEARV